MVWFIGGSEAENTGIKALEAELARASDRAAAILAGSLIETRLTAFLKANVQDDKKIWERITHSSAPIGSFSAKIDVAYLFRLISKEAHTDLVTMKNIRNAFAHDLTIQDFDTQSIRDQCKNLKLAEIYVEDSLYMNSIRTLEDGTRDSIMNSDRSFRIGSRNALSQIQNPRNRYIWTTKIFNLALGLVPVLPPMPLAWRDKPV